MKLAKHYTEEHTNQDGTYEIDKHFPCLLVSKLQSRHISNCRYQCWIRYSEGAVTSWYCRCRSGARVVDACVNITSVIWYLAYARHANVRVQTNRNWLDSVEDAAQISEAVDESDSGTEVTEEWLMSENDWLWHEEIHYFNVSSNCFFLNRLQQYLLYNSNFTFHKCLALNLIFLYWYYNIKSHTRC